MESGARKGCTSVSGTSFSPLGLAIPVAIFEVEVVFINGGFFINRCGLINDICDQTGVAVVPLIRKKYRDTDEQSYDALYEYDYIIIKYLFIV